MVCGTDLWAFLIPAETLSSHSGCLKVLICFHTGLWRCCKFFFSNSSGGGIDLGTQKPLPSDLDFDVPLKHAAVFSNIHISCVLRDKSASLMIKCVAGRAAAYVWCWTPAAHLQWQDVQNWCALCLALLSSCHLKQTLHAQVGSWIIKTQDVHSVFEVLVI